MAAGAICSTVISNTASNATGAALSGLDNFRRNNLTPPAMISQVSNTPCMSNELGRISNQMGTMLRGGVAGVGSAVGMTGSPISTLMNAAFKQDFQAFNSAARSIPAMLNFQGMASQALGGVLDSLGLGGAFGGMMCGIMLDMVLKYIQCENPIKFPNLSDLFGKLNLNLPGGCAGQALRQGIYGVARTDAVKGLSQSVSRGANGTFSAAPLQ